ncbi:MAG: NAD(P)/FAD-dependent oxidoreductase [Chloroflexota bacterium]
MYDAIVVGAGPAGSTAAIVLAQKGLHTLLVDRESFPREKACGDAVPATCFEILRDLNVNDFGPEEIFSINRIFVKGPLKRSIALDLHQQGDANAGIVSRYVFDRALYDHALASGAEFCQLNVQGPLLEAGKVVGIRAKSGKHEIEYRSKIVIAADGATSVIARALNPTPRTDSTTAIALRGYIETDVDLDRTIDLVFLSEVQPGYAWFFPMNKHQANIGVGMRADRYKNQDKTLQEMLDLYLKSPEIRDRVGQHKVTDLRSWQLPLCLVDQPRVFDGALLAGDAGGFVDPLTGAGIYQAVLTGKRAAEASIHAIEINDVSARGLALYDKLWRKDLGRDIKRSARMYQMITAMPSLIDGMLIAARAIPSIVPYVLGKI